MAWGGRIVFTDEAYFTTETMAKKAWANVGENLTVKAKDVKVPVWRLVAAISMEFGVESFLLFSENINSTLFCKILP